MNNYPLHPNATHPPVMTCEIPLEEYESLKRENAELKGEIKRLENVRKVHIEGIESMSEGLKLDAKQICRLKRALWMARAMRANEAHFMWCQLIYDRKYGIVKFNIKKECFENVKQGQTLHTPQGWADVWDEVEYRCLKKSKEYK